VVVERRDAAGEAVDRGGEQLAEPGEDDCVVGEAHLEREVRLVEYRWRDPLLGEELVARDALPLGGDRPRILLEGHAVDLHRAAPAYDGPLAWGSREPRREIASSGSTRTSSS